MSQKNQIIWTLSDAFRRLEALKLEDANAISTFLTTYSWQTKTSEDIETIRKSVSKENLNRLRLLFKEKNKPISVHQWSAELLSLFGDNEELQLIESELEKKSTVQKNDFEELNYQGRIISGLNLNNKASIERTTIFNRIIENYIKLYIDKSKSSIDDYSQLRYIIITIGNSLSYAAQGLFNIIFFQME